MALRLRELTTEEREALRQLVHSRTEPAQRVERARIVWLKYEGVSCPKIAKWLGLTLHTVHRWVKRLNAHGLAALEDKPRSGRPPTYSPEQVAVVIETALTDPHSLGLPFASWTLDRLERYLNEEKGIGMKRSRIDEVLLAEGLRWRAQESWFSERAAPRVDPQFAEKRGRSPRSTRHHRQKASSSASTKWGRKAPRASGASD